MTSDYQRGLHWIDLLDSPEGAWLAQALIPRPAWHADAACREHPEVNFYPTRGEDARPAKAVCAGCLVVDECLADALEHRDRNGIWGGTGAGERIALRRPAA